MRHLVLALAAVLLTTLFVAGCGGDKAEDDGQTRYRIAVIPKGNSHEFWQSVKAGAEGAAAELGDVDLTFKGPATENDLTQQRELFETHLTRGTQAIGIAPVNGDALGPVIDTANGRAPVVVFDSGTSASHTASFIATDNLAAGRKAGEELVRLLPNGGKVVILRYKSGSISTEQREQGFIDAITAAGNFEIVSDDQEGAGREKEIAQTLVQRFAGDVQAIYTPNESTTTGMMLSLREAGAYASDLVHIGFDSTPEIIASIQNNEIKAVVVQDPVAMGRLTVITLRAVLAGETVEPVIDTGSQLVTTETLADPALRSLVGLE